MPSVIALVISDLHLTLTPPVARSAEKNWLRAMQRQVDELNELQVKHSKAGSLCPVICCGDVFDKWNPPVELVNWALTHLPHLIAVPGQHDLAYHSLDSLKKTGFFTLVKAAKITPLLPNKPVQINEMILHGLPFGTEITPCQNPHSLCLDVAVVHSYVWVKGCCYPGAPKEKRAKNLVAKLEGYNAALFGDNHKGFTWNKVYNVGTFFRRKMDEVDYRPAVGLLRDDGSVTRHYLDCSKDAFIQPEEALRKAEDGEEMQAFLEELNQLGDNAVDYAAAVRQASADNNVREPVRRAVIEALEKNSK